MSYRSESIRVVILWMVCYTIANDEQKIEEYMAKVFTRCLSCGNINEFSANMMGSNQQCKSCEKQVYIPLKQFAPRKVVKPLVILLLVVAVVLGTLYYLVF